MEVEVVRDLQAQLRPALIPPFHPLGISLHPAWMWGHWEVSHFHWNIILFGMSTSYLLQTLVIYMLRVSSVFCGWLFSPIYRDQSKENSLQIIIVILLSLFLHPCHPHPSISELNSSTYLFFFLSEFLWIKSEHGRRIIFSKVTHSCKGNPEHPTIDIASFSSVTLNKYI